MEEEIVIRNTLVMTKSLSMEFDIILRGPIKVCSVVLSSYVWLIVKFEKIDILLDLHTYDFRIIKDKLIILLLSPRNYLLDFKFCFNFSNTF